MISLSETTEIEDYKIQSLSTDKDTKTILESIRKTPKSTSQLCIECNIPTSTAYRKMQKLYESKIIHKIGIINEAGKRETLYKSNNNILKILQCEEIC